MKQPAFWEDLADKFEKLRDPGNLLSADWTAITGKEYAGRWILRPEADTAYGARVGIAYLATKGVRALNIHPGPLQEISDDDPLLVAERLVKAGRPDPLDSVEIDWVEDPWLNAWLEVLRAQSPEFKGRRGRGWIGDHKYEAQNGTIRDLCRASANHCLNVATRVITARPDDILSDAGADSISPFRGPPARPESAPQGKATTAADNNTRLRRREIISRYRQANELDTMADFARHVAMSLSAIEGIVRGDATRYGEETLLKFLKKIDVLPGNW